MDFVDIGAWLDAGHIYVFGANGGKVGEAQRRNHRTRAGGLCKGLCANACRAAAQYEG